jgi:hypothetical protein
MKRFEFTVFGPVAGAKHTFAPTTVTKEAETFEAAVAKLTESHPGHCVAEHLRGLWREVK